MINFDNAIKFPFAQKDWQKNVGIYFLILLAISILTGITNAIFKLPADFLSELARNQANDNLSQIASSTYMMSAFASGLIGLITIPVTLYLAGYLFNTTRNVLFGVEDPIKPHGEITTRLKYGAAKLLIGLVIGLVSLLLFIVPAIVGAAAYLSTREAATTLGIVMWTLAGIIFIVWLFVTAFIINFAQYAMEYLYLTEGLRKTFNISKIWRIIKGYWKEFLILFGIELAGGFAMVMTVFTCCFQFIAQPVLQTIVSFVLAYCYGMVFKQIYSETKGNK